MPEILNSGLVEINSNTVDKVFELFHSHPLNSIPYWKGMHTLSSIKIPPKANEKSLFIPSGYTRVLIFLLRVFFFSSPREHEEKQRDWNFSNTTQSSKIFQFLRKIKIHGSVNLSFWLLYSDE